MEIFIRTDRLQEKIKLGVSKLIESGEYAIFAEKTQNSTEVEFKQNRSNGFEIRLLSNGTAEVGYAESSDAFRAIARLLGIANNNRDFLKTNYSEESHFEFRCVMLEASRNGVMTVNTIKAFLRRFALMGLNAACLYTEDTYEVPGEPFFGYLRGAYTQKELKECDDYATDLGIEMFPCIQTLGHLKQILQWGNAYRNVTDTDQILLVGEPETYKLLKRMISSISSCFRSKRIHVGMDEAHGLGSGQYKKTHGERSSFDIINEHLKQVVGICKDMDLRPMIWSDMYFRLGSATNDYYDLNSSIPESVIADIPPEIDLVYWDYYHKSDGFYLDYIDKHRAMRKEPVVAPGAWTWGRFWTALPYAYDTILPCLSACREKNVKQVFLTTWGDEGMEVDIYSALPAIQFFAELCYGETVDKKHFADNLNGSCGINLDAYDLGSELDSCAVLDSAVSTMANISKWLLWDDPLIGLCEPQQQNKSFRDHYTKLAGKLNGYAQMPSPQYKRLQFPAQLAHVLSIKCDIRKKLVRAYLKNDKVELSNLLSTEVRPLLGELKKLWKLHRDMWLATYKPFGLEVIENRYGGLIARTESLVNRLEDFLGGKSSGIPEFETELHAFDKGSPESLSYIGTHSRMASPSAIY